MKRRRLTRYADVKLVIGVALVACGAADAIAAFHYRDPLSWVPAAAGADVRETILRTLPFIALAVAVAVGSAVAGDALTAAMVAAGFAGWGIQELRLRQLTRRWERKRMTLIVAEPPAIFVAGKLGKMYRRPSSGAL